MIINADLLYYVGKTFDDTLLEGIKKAAGPSCATVRVWTPGMMGTMDYRTDRLNVNLNEENVVKSITIG